MRLSAWLGLGAGVAAGAAATAAARGWLDAAEVHGRSMAPALLPGDRLLLESRSYESRAPHVGEVVLAPDPREPERELIKRVAAVDDAAETVELRGDAPEASTDSRVFGAIPLHAIRWRAAYRYWPIERRGRL